MQQLFLRPNRKTRQARDADLWCCGWFVVLFQVGVCGFQIVWFPTSLSLTHTHIICGQMPLSPNGEITHPTVFSPPFFSRCPLLIDIRGPLGASRLSSTDDDAPYDPANEPYLKDITRGQICAFMTGFSSFLKETEVTVKSIVHFMPGMRVAIATQDHDISVFERWVQQYCTSRLTSCIWVSSKK